MMGATTAIAWTDHTFNPWWGCERVSPGCQHCYAEAFAKRTGNDVWGKSNDRRYFGDKHWAEPIKWNRAAEAAGRQAMVFCASMADVFEDRAEHVEHRIRLFELIRCTPALTWQLLTKRPENVNRMWDLQKPIGWTGRMPINIWIGTTVEDQQRGDERIPHLQQIDAKVRFLSCEPLLERLDLHDYLSRVGIDWVICGGESGAGHRPLDLDAARSLRDQCRLWGVPFFFKQVGGRTPTAGGDLLDGERIKDFP